MSERKAIFITGGGSGIGRAIAQRFAGLGWFVGLGDVNEAGMAETAALLPDGQSFSYTFDVRDRGAWDAALAAFAEASGGRIDMLANNAGVAIGGLLANLTQDEIDLCLDVNLRGVIYGAQAVYPYLKASAPGSCLLNTGSAAGIYGVGAMSVYCATKMGVRAVTESLDGEWAREGIRVRSLMPSFIDTPLLSGPSNHGDNTSMHDRVASAGLEFTPVEEVANAAWDAAHGEKLHWVIGKTAKKSWFAARWTPGKLRRAARGMARAMGR
ncbi:MAG: SDR family oxidoreductase [Sphingomonadaceae bacterium]